MSCEIDSSISETFGVISLSIYGSIIVTFSILAGLQLKRYKLQCRWLSCCNKVHQSPKESSRSGHHLEMQIIDQGKRSDEVKIAMHISSNSTQTAANDNNDANSGKMRFYLNNTLDLKTKYKIGRKEIKRGNYGVIYKCKLRQTYINNNRDKIDEYNNKTLMIERIDKEAILSQFKQSKLENDNNNNSNYNEIFQMLQTEFYQLKSLISDNPNIVSIYDIYFENDSNLIDIVSEYVANGTNGKKACPTLLEQVYSYQQQFNEKECFAIMNRIFLALRYMHNQNAYETKNESKENDNMYNEGGILHLDLNPQNIICQIDNNINININGRRKENSNGTSRDITIKIAYYGFGRTRSEYAKMREFISSKIQYTAPEVFKQKYTTAADVWSAGIILFFMTFGFVPFFSKSGTQREGTQRSRQGKHSNIATKSIRQRIMKTGFINEIRPKQGAWFPQDKPISDELRELIANMLKSDPNERWTIEQCKQSSWYKNHTLKLWESLEDDNGYSDSESYSTYFEARQRFGLTTVADIVNTNYNNYNYDDNMNSNDNYNSVRFAKELMHQPTAGQMKKLQSLAKPISRGVTPRAKELNKFKSGASDTYSKTIATGGDLDGKSFNIPAPQVHVPDALAPQLMSNISGTHGSTPELVPLAPLTPTHLTHIADPIGVQVGSSSAPPATQVVLATIGAQSEDDMQDKAVNVNAGHFFTFGSQERVDDAKMDGGKVETIKEETKQVTQQATNDSKQINHVDQSPDASGQNQLELLETKNKQLKWIGQWMHETYRYKKCYASLITHILDQITDFTVLIQFGQLWRLETEKNENGFDYCQHVNGAFLFWICLSSLLLYRIVSGWSIYHQTNKWYRFLFQFFDLELFRALYVNYKTDSNSPCNPQRWIQSLETILESSPQAVLQLFFLIKTGTSNNVLVFLSFCWSMWSITNKAVSEDKMAFCEQFQDSSIECKEIPKYFCIRGGYVGRLTFRIIDVVYRVCMIVLIWIFLGGLDLFVIIFCEMVVLGINCVKTDDYGLINCLMLTPLTSTKRNQQFVKYFRRYRNHSNTVFLAVVYFFVLSDFECNIVVCVDYDTRKFLLESSLPAIVCMLAVATLCELKFGSFIDYVINNMIDKSKEISTDRDIIKLVKTRDWKGISELYLFGVPMPKEHLHKDIYLDILAFGDDAIFHTLGFDKIVQISQTVGILMTDSNSNPWKDYDNIDEILLFEKCICNIESHYKTKFERYINIHVDNKQSKFKIIRDIFIKIVQMNENQSDYAIFCQDWSCRDKQIFLNDIHLHVLYILLQHCNKNVDYRHQYFLIFRDILVEKESFLNEMTMNDDDMNIFGQMWSMFVGMTGIVRGDWTVDNLKQLNQDKFEGIMEIINKFRDINEKETLQLLGKLSDDDNYTITMDWLAMVSNKREKSLSNHRKYIELEKKRKREKEAHEKEIQQLKSETEKLKQLEHDYKQEYQEHELERNRLKLLIEKEKKINTTETAKLKIQIGEKKQEIEKLTLIYDKEVKQTKSQYQQLQNEYQLNEETHKAQIVGLEAEIQNEKRQREQENSQWQGKMVIQDSQHKRQISKLKTMHEIRIHAKDDEIESLKGSIATLTGSTHIRQHSRSAFESSKGKRRKSTYGQKSRFRRKMTDVDVQYSMDHTDSMDTDNNAFLRIDSAFLGGSFNSVGHANSIISELSQRPRMVNDTVDQGDGDTEDTFDDDFDEDDDEDDDDDDDDDDEYDDEYDEDSDEQD